MMELYSINDNMKPMNGNSQTRTVILAPSILSIMARAHDRERAAAAHVFYLGLNYLKALETQKWARSLGLVFPDPSRIFRAACLRVKQPFVDLMGRMAVQSGSPDWWLLPCSAKSHYLSPLFYNVSAFEMIRAYARQVPSADLFLVIETPALARVFEMYFRGQGWTVKRYSGRPKWSPMRLLKDIARYWGPRLSFLKDELFKRFVLNSAKNSLPSAGSRVTMIRTWFFSTSGLNGRFSDVYFEGLADLIRTTGRSAWTVLAIQRSRDVRRLKSFLDRTPGFAAIEQIVGVTDVFKILWKTIRPFSFRCPEARLGDADLTPLIAEEIRSSRFSPVVALALIHDALAKRLRERGIIVDAVYLPFENQPWEKWFMRALKSLNPSIWICGYQHAVVFELQLAYVSSADELRIVPRPDTIVCNGERYAAHFRSLGYPDVRVGYPLRYAALDKSAPAAARPAREFRCDFLVCTSASYPETQELVHRLVCLFDGISCRIAVKVHSLIDWNQVCRDLKLFDVIVPASWKVTNEPLGKLFQECKAMIWTSTSAYLDALASGCPVIHMVTSHTMDIDWIDLPQSCAHVYPEEGFETVLERVGMLDANPDSKPVREFVRERLAFYLSRESFPTPPVRDIP